MPWTHDPSKGREIGNETLQAVLKMYDEQPFQGYQGQHFNLPGRDVLPRPIQAPHPPMWVAATNLETYDYAARQGYGVIGVTRNSVDVTVDRRGIRGQTQSRCM